MTQKYQTSTKPKQSRGKVPPFFISLETEELIIHNCMVDSGDTHNIMPLPIMKTIGIGFTRNYEDGECRFSIDSIRVPAYGDINYFCAWISLAPHITTIFTIIVVNLPLADNLVLGQEWSYPHGGYIMNDKSFLMILNKDDDFTRVPQEARKPSCYQRKENC